MEQGNEGDEILFFSCRQIGCEIPANVKRVGDMSAELLIQVIAKSLLLISNGEIQVSTQLPPNIAVRHRICTDISMKIKDLGFHGECGYNQLLYPVEHQTRDLLKWIIGKVPRTQEEGGGAEEILGANAILNRNIMKSLQTWHKSLWRLPICEEGKPPVNIYKKISFTACASGSSFSAARLLHKHSLDKIRDAQLTERMNRKFKGKGNNAGANGGGDGGDDGFAAENANGLLQQKILASLKEKKSNASSSSSSSSGGAAGGDDSAFGGDGDSTSSSRADAQMNMSFQELVKSIANSHAEHGGANGEEQRGGRFAHATMFSQEDSAVIAASSSSAVSISQAVLSAAASTGFNASALSAEHAAKLASITKDGIEAAQKFAKMDLQERKAQMELEEQDRQQQLQTVKSDIEDLSVVVDKGKAFEEKILKAINTLEEELERLQKETDSLEKECIIKKKALEMIPSASDNIAKLQGICDNSTQRLNALESEWAKVRDPLETELQAKERRKAARLNRVATMIEEIKKYREVMASMVHDLKEQQDRAQMLEEEKSKLPKNLNRALYTHRIMDITNSIAKQNKEIDKITSDIRDLQKTINLSSNTLSRADAITEELIFKAASDKQDPVMVDIYRKLKQLRSSFESLVGTVSNIGATEKNARDLETKIEQERNRVSAQNFERIQNDLQAITQENQAILSEVKKLAGNK